MHNISYVEGFELEGTESYKSLSEGAKLILNLDGAYLDHILLHIGLHVNTPIALKFYSENKLEGVTLTRPWQLRLKTTPYNFMRAAVFRVEDRPKQLEITAQGAGLVIAGIVAVKKEKYNIRRGGIIGFGWFIFLVGVWAFFSRGLDVGRVLVLILLAVSGAMALGTQLNFVSWDESIHYRRANLQSLQAIVPQTTHDVFSRAHVLPFSYSYREQKQINEFFNAQKLPQNSTVVSPNSTNAKDKWFHWYREIGYIPPAVGLFFGRVFEFPNHAVFQVGRISNVIFYIGIIFLTVQVLPFGRITLAAVASLPTPVFIAAHYSYDPWLTSLSFLSFALFINALQSNTEKISSLQKILLIAVPFAAVGPKAIYCLIILLPLLIPNDRLGGLRPAIVFKAAACFAFLFAFASFALPFLVDGPGRGDSRGGAGVNSTDQVAYMLANPVVYIGNLLDFMTVYLNPLNMRGLSVDFSGLGLIDGFFILLALVAVALWMDFTEPKPAIALPVITRIIVLVGCFITVALIATALYISFTPVGSPRFSGVQSRYLLPLLAPIMLLLIPITKHPKALLGTTQKGALILTPIGLLAVYGVWTSTAASFY